MDWSKVVTHPLGLGGFALALVFTALSRSKAEKMQWLKPAAFSLAGLALIGGIGIAYRQVDAEHKTASGSDQRTGSPVSINANGCGVAAVEVSGSVAIQTNCSQPPSTKASVPTANTP